MTFQETLHAHGLDLTRNETTWLQVNVGLACDLACKHCHLATRHCSHGLFSLHPLLLFAQLLLTLGIHLVNLPHQLTLLLKNSSGFLHNRLRIQTFFGSVGQRWPGLAILIKDKARWSDIVLQAILLLCL